jgi:hypothetical protein
MAGSVYTLKVIGEFTVKESQVFVPAKDQSEFFKFADAAEAHKGEFQYRYIYSDSVDRKPRNMPLWSE